MRNILVGIKSRNYLNDEILEEEVNTMTKTLYDPEVERKGREEGREEGREQGREEGREQERIQNAKNLLSMGIESKIVAAGTGLTIEKVEELRKDIDIPSEG